MSFSFPSLVPEERTYSAGIFRQDARPDLSAAAVRFLRSRVATAHRLELAFSLGSREEVSSILEHWDRAQGTFLPFGVLPETWCGTDHRLASSWRFAEAPQATDVSPGRWSVSVILVSVTFDLPVETLPPIAAGTTVAIVAETPPVPPRDPFGTFFAARDQALRLEVYGGLALTARVFPPATATIEIRGGGALTLPTGFASEPGTLEIASDASLVVVQRNNVTVRIAMSEIDLEESGTILGVDFSGEAYRSLVYGATVALAFAGLGTLSESESIVGVVAVPYNYSVAAYGPTVVASVSGLGTVVESANVS